MLAMLHPFRPTWPCRAHHLGDGAVIARCSHPSDHSQSHSCHTWGTKPGSTINTLRGSHPSVRPSCKIRFPWHFHATHAAENAIGIIFWYIGMLLLARDPLSGTMPSLHSPQVVDFPSWNKQEKRLERQGSNIDSLAAQFAPIGTGMRLSSTVGTVGLSSIPLRAGLHRWWTPVHPPQHWAHARYCPPPGHANICQYAIINQWYTWKTATSPRLQCASTTVLAYLPVALCDRPCCDLQGGSAGSMSCNGKLFNWFLLPCAMSMTTKTAGSRWLKNKTLLKKSQITFEGPTKLQ